MTELSPDQSSPKSASNHTATLNRAQAEGLKFATDDFELARRGFIAAHPTGVIGGPFGVPAWDLGQYDFLDRNDVPDTVNPSLWRHAQLNNIHGLFEVDKGLWQVRGYDISVVSFIEGRTGWIVIDPLTTEATAAAALELVNRHLGERPVKAVIYTHSHTDHYGGVRGVTSVEAVAAGDVEILAPDGFMDEVVAESLIAGNAMFRRAFYQFGVLLAPGERGHVDAGLGKAIVKAQPGLIAPTVEISSDGEERTVDGIRIVFQNTPDAEAPAEMNFFFPDQGWLCMAENCTHTMHNLIPFRGAKARDSLAWSTYIDEALARFGPRTKLVFASHHWPRWGHDKVVDYLARQRDLYRWIHDQTMRLAARGLVANEIAETLELPSEFADESFNRGYYGSLVHNVKAVYQLYLSWYDGNPAHLWPHPPTEAGKRYVEFMGGADRLLEQARASFADGDYRWVAEVVNHLVFAEPDNSEARALQADALEQLGYQAESATWRNAYLTGAMELRGATPPVRAVHRVEMVEALSLNQLVDTMAIRLQSENLANRSTVVKLELTDTADEALVVLSNRTLRWCAVDRFDHGDIDGVLRCSKSTLAELVTVAVTIEDAIAQGRAVVFGRDHVETIFNHLDVHYTGFPVVTP